MKNIATVLALVAVLAGCETEAQRVSYNLSQQADNFNDIRQVTVINCLQGDVLFQMTGKMSITADTEDNQLEIVVEDENGEYKKHFIGLSDNVTYVVEDVTSGDVNQYKYTLNFNPKMWLPEISTIEYSHYIYKKVGRWSHRSAHGGGADSRRISDRRSN